MSALERGELFDLDALEPPPAPRSRFGSALAVLAALPVCYGIFMLGVMAASKTKKPEPVGPFVASQTVISAPSKEPAIKVHVVGRIKRPGVYALPSGARVQDALHRAGGPLPGADTDALNLADWAKDGSRIEVAAQATPVPLFTPTPLVIVREVRVPVPVTQKAGALNTSLSAQGQSRDSRLSIANSDVPAPAKSAAPRVKKSDPGYLASLQREPINLNEASVEELQTLPGVGPKMAERIIAHREENGPFSSVDELDEVKGIGQKKLEALRAVVTVK